jgi:hypothetical protein
MKITEYISQGIHSINPLNESKWLGRAIKPIKGPLKWTLPVAILAGAVFYLGYWRYPTQDKLQKIPQPEKKQAYAEEFCNQHGIKFESALLGEIDAIRRTFEDWTDTDDKLVWNSRIRELSTQMQKLPQNAEVWAMWVNLQNPKEEVKPIYNRFTALLDSLALAEAGKEKLFLPTIASALQEMKESAPLTFAQFLESVVPKDRLDRVKKDLGERGVVSLADIDVLNIRNWEQELAALEDFRCVLRKLPENHSILKALQNFLTQFGTKIGNECRSDLLSTAENYCAHAPTVISVLETPNGDIEWVIQRCKELYQEKQCVLLDAYINQFKCALHWSRLKENKPTMTLSELQSIHGDDKNYFRLSDFLILE